MTVWTAWDVLLGCLERQRDEITKTIEALKISRPECERPDVCEVDLTNAPVLRELLGVAKLDAN